MKPLDRFLRKPKSFWASVRSLSQHIGYSSGGRIVVPTVEQMARSFEELSLDPSKLVSNGVPTPLAKELIDYFSTRADLLVKIAEPNLMHAQEAKQVFTELRNKLNPKCPIPMNKQKATMRAEAFMTGMVNMMVEKHSAGWTCDFDPRELTTVTRDFEPLRTLARRVDGAFPSTINPIAIWEVKEYYYTTTFGSRIADGIYESLLDGLELEELREHENIDVKHYLMLDAYHTWWNMGKPYLCRVVDMLHMGYVDEVLFGKEVLKEMPRIVAEWIVLADQRGKPGLPEA